MYENLEDLLRDWGVEDLIEAFKSNDIDISNFFTLTEEYIKEIIPSVGKRLKFMPLFEKGKLLNNCDIAQVVNDQESVLIESNLVQANLHYDDFCEKENIPNNNNQFYVINNEPREVAAIGLENLVKNIELPDFDLKTLLSTSIFGTKILDYYSENKNLNTTSRNKLTDIIIKHLFNYIAQHRLTPEDYTRITGKIITLFPSECASTYFVPAIKKKDSINGKSVLARGKLVDKCRNLLHACSGTSCVSVKRLKNSDDKLTTKKLILEVPEDMKNDLDFLKNRVEPFEDIYTKWKNTFDYRQNNQFKTITDFYKEWPILATSNFDTLINYDFDQIYPGSSFKLIENWEICFETIFKTRKISTKDKLVEELLIILDKNDISKDTKFISQLLMLPYLIPPKGKLSIKGKGLWKFSITECMQALVCHAKLPCDIQILIEKNKKDAECRKQTVQPYLIIQGINLLEIKKSYIIVDDIKHEVNNFIRAFDLCFKLHMVTNAEFAPPAAHILTLIQRGIFKISTKYDKVFPYCEDLITTLEKLP